MKFINAAIMSLFLMASLGLTACDSNDNSAERVGEKVDDTFDEARDSVDDAADEVSDSVEDACEEVSDENC